MIRSKTSVIISSALIVLSLSGTAVADQSEYSAAGTDSAVLDWSGAESGITPREAARIRNQIREYKQLIRLVNADNRVTRREQKMLDEKAAQIRRLIYLAKNN